LEDALAPREDLLGREGEGWIHLQECGAGLRAWGAAAQALGMAEGAIAG